jgi:uncharacterized protein (DUF433 family)
MSDAWKERISLDPEVLCGKPVIKGTRISVELVLESLGNGWSIADLLESYPHITEEDIRACLSYAGNLLGTERIYPVTA